MSTYLGLRHGLHRRHVILSGVTVLVVIAACFGSSPRAFAAAKPGDLLWSMRVGGSDHDAFYDVARTPDGGVVAVGVNNVASAWSVGDALIVKYSAAGVQQWAKAYDYGDGRLDVLTDVVVGQGGAIVAAGYHSGTTTNNDFLVVKYDAAGGFVWSTLVHGGGSFSDEVSDVCVDAAGDVRVVGTAHEPGNEALCVARLDGASGILTWQLVTYGPAGSTWATGASGAGTSNGALYVAGQVYSPTSHWRALLMKIRANGTVAWTRAWRPKGFTGAFGRVVRLDPRGRPWVLAELPSGVQSDVLLMRYSTAGARQLVRRYGFTGQRADYPEDMVIDGSGRIFASGYSDSAPPATAAAGFVLSYSKDGVRRFARLYRRTAPRDTYFSGLLADGKGGAFVCGMVTEPHAYRHRLVAHYTATGNRAWARSVTNMATQGDDRYEALARCGSAGVVAVGSFLYAANDVDAVAEKYQR